MKKKLFKNILLAMAGTLLFSLVLIILVLNQNFAKIETGRLSSQANMVQAGIETSGMNYLKQLDEKEFRITWIDDDGTVLYDNTTDPKTMENHGNREEFIEARINGEASIRRYSSTIAKDTYYYAKRLNDNSVIRLSQTNDSVFALTLRLATPILWIFILATIVSAILANRLASHIAEPINSIDLDHPLANNSYEEIRPLLTRIHNQNQQIDRQIEELHRKKKEFLTITDNVSEALILLNTEGKTVFFNKAALTLFHKEETDIDSIMEMEQIRQLVNTVLMGKDSEAVITMEDETIRVIGRPIFSRKILTGASLLAYDITETYSLELQRREFSANVSHELKTPLQAIMGSTELLSNGLVKKGDESTFYERIHDESARMLTLIDDIIRLSQLDEDAPVEETKVDLSDLASETIEALSTAAFKKNIRLETDLHTAIIKANSRMIYEIFYNLIDNAIRYSENDTSILIRTWVEKDQAWLSVQDHGCGIPKESQARIFERFYRVDKSHSRATGGTGLGLSIVKHSVARCHGNITLSSRVNEGSTFTVNFPLLNR